MATTIPFTALVPTAPVITNMERLALAGFLAGCSGLTRQSYELDLRQFASWCQQHQLRLFQARRADIEFFARDLEARGRARATITRRLCTVAGFYRYAVEEELLDHSPAAHVRRPRLDYESHATGLDRNELGALLVAAGPGPSAEHALISLLALNALRVSEATGADIHALGVERGHRTLVVTRKGGKVVTIPLAPRTARRSTWPSANAPSDPSSWRRLDRHGAGRIVRRVARRAGITKTIGPTPCGTRSSPRRWMRVSRCGTCRKLLPTLTRAPLCVTTGPEPPWTGTPPTSSSPMSPGPPGRALASQNRSAWSATTGQADNWQHP
jgi:integrase